MTDYLLLLIFVGLIAFLSQAGRKNKVTQTNSKMTNHYGKISRTERGDKVRSKGEKIIADWLYLKKIKYQYELKLSTYVPDFYLPEYKIIIEYYGLRDAPGRIGNEYRKKVEEKREYFSTLSARFIELYQEDLTRLDGIISPLLPKVEQIRGKRS